MSKVTVYIPAMALKKVDLYCKEKKTSRSRFLTNAALSIINAQGNVFCEYQSCKNPAIGKFKLTVYNLEQGESEKIMNVCDYHYKKALNEGVRIDEV